jgi:sec-independent protein translocase protein TatC
MITSENNSELVYYLSEFRKRMLYCLFMLISLFSVLLYFANSLYTLLALPLLKHLPHGQGLIATNVVAPFFVPFELTLVTAVFLGMPFFLYQLWMFVAPALYRSERKLIWPLLLASIILFYAGIAFAYFVIFPIIFTFFIHSAPKGVLVSPDISQYLDFTLKLFLTFGTIFEVPIVTVLLVSSGMVSREKLIEIRPYAIVSAFIIGMLLAPPDVISQTLLAIPLWLLFEVGILLSRFFTNGNGK